MITLSTASAVLRHKQANLQEVVFDYIVYCFGGIETFLLSRLQFS